METMYVEMENMFTEKKKKDDVNKMAAYATKLTKNPDTVERLKAYADKMNKEKGE